MKAKIIGLLLLIESAFMGLSTLVSVYYNKIAAETDFVSLFISTVITLFVGLIFYIIGNHNKNGIDIKGSFLVTTVSWIMFSVFGMLPFILYGTFDNITDAFFETMSAFSTTGSTVMNNIDEQPHGILFWRSIMQWLGGLGIIVFSLAFIPSVGKGSKKMVLFAAEAPGLSVDKLHPRMQETALRLWLIYAILTALCALCYWLGPMNIFDAVCHSLTTIATGGLSTHQASIGYWDSPYLEYVSSVFMLLGGINFSLYFFLAIGRGSLLWKDEETRWYVGLVLGLVALFGFLFYAVPYFSLEQGTAKDLPVGFSDIIRYSLFHVASILTSTGYQAGNYNFESWGWLFIIPTILMMSCGACAGSTSGGKKIIREIICLKHIRNEFKHLLHPNAVSSIKVSGKIIPDNTLTSVLTFMYLYVLLMGLCMLLYALCGLSLMDSFGLYITGINNGGPALGIAGPANTFSTLPDAAKWISSFVMMIGRLEIFTVLILFTRFFWKKSN